jgi:signal transduction histidine kinase
MTDVSVKERTEADLRRQAAFVRLSREVAVAANGSVDVAENHASHPPAGVRPHAVARRARAPPAPDRASDPTPSVWHLTDQVRFGSFAASSEARAVERGVGMIGGSGRGRSPPGSPSTTPIAFSAARRRSPPASTGAVAFPVLVGTKVVGVLEFFSVHRTAPDRRRHGGDRRHRDATRRVIERARAEEDLRDYTERLETLSRRLLQAQETERRHVACELHDEIGQALTALKLNLQNATDEVARGAARAATAAMIEQSIALVDRTLQQTRDLFARPAPGRAGRSRARTGLRWCLSRQGERAGFVTEFHSDVDDVVPSEIATTCFRIAQEALTNVARHARATRSRWRSRARRGIELVIRDFGRGFDREQATMRAERGKSLGLLSMGERAALIGGTLTIDSTMGRGTVVRAQLPVPTI